MQASATRCPRTMLNCRLVFWATSQISLSSPLFAMFPSSSCTRTSAHHLRLLLHNQMHVQSPVSFVGQELAPFAGMKQHNAGERELRVVTHHQGSSKRKQADRKSMTNQQVVPPLHIVEGHIPREICVRENR